MACSCKQRRQKNDYGADLAWLGTGSQEIVYIFVAETHHFEKSVALSIEYTLIPNTANAVFENDLYTMIVDSSLQGVRFASDVQEDEFLSKHPDLTRESYR